MNIILQQTKEGYSCKVRDWHIWIRSSISGISSTSMAILRIGGRKIEIENNEAAPDTFKRLPYTTPSHCSRAAETMRFSHFGVSLPNNILFQAL